MAYNIVLYWIHQFYEHHYESASAAEMTENNNTYCIFSHSYTHIRHNIVFPKPQQIKEKLSSGFAHNVLAVHFIQISARQRTVNLAWTVNGTVSANPSHKRPNGSPHITRILLWCKAILIVRFPRFVGIWKYFDISTSWKRRSCSASDFSHA